VNLFWSTRSMTSSKEDHLTEFFAAALELSTKARDAYFDTVIKGFAHRKGWARCGIRGIETQFSFDDSTCRPDLMLTLTNGKRIICEHKLNSIQTPGPECDERDQLERYVELPVDGVVYVRSELKSPGARVLRHPKYVRPAEREHFLWRDFYHIFKDQDHRFIAWLRDGFQQMGFTPPHPSVGDLKATDEQERDKNRRNFAKLWTRTRTSGQELGWDSEAGSISDLYMTNERRVLASMVYCSVKSDGLRIRVSPRKGCVNACFTQIEQAVKTQSVRTELNPKRIRRGDAKFTVYDITTTLSGVFGPSNQSADDMEDRLCAFVTHFLLAVRMPK